MISASIHCRKGHIFLELRQVVKDRIAAKSKRSIQDSKESATDRKLMMYPEPYSNSAKHRRILHRMPSLS